MTRKISLTAMKSAGIHDVPAAVANQAQQMKDWLERKRLVDNLDPLPVRPEWVDFRRSADPTTDYTAAMDKWTQLVRVRPALFPAPISHPDIMAAINENGEPDFELIDDSPTPDDVLAMKKGTLFQKVTDAENAALNKVTPPGKRRLFDIKEADVRAADARRLEPINKRRQEVSSQLATVLAQLHKTPDDADLAATQKELETESKALSAKMADPESVHAVARPAADQNVLDESVVRLKKRNDIIRQAAQGHSDIEDLTLDNVDAFEIPSL
jgi:hypothetical protein